MSFNILQPSSQYVGYIFGVGLWRTFTGSKDRELTVSDSCGTCMRTESKSLRNAVVYVHQFHPPFHNKMYMVEGIEIFRELFGTLEMTVIIGLVSDEYLTSIC